MVRATMTARTTTPTAFGTHNRRHETRWSPKSAILSERFYSEGTCWPRNPTPAGQWLRLVSSSTDQESTENVQEGSTFLVDSPHLFGRPNDGSSSLHGVEEAHANASKLVLMTVLMSRLLRTRPASERIKEDDSRGSVDGTSEALNAAISKVEQSPATPAESQLPSVPLPMGSSGPIPEVAEAAATTATPTKQEGEEIPQKTNATDASSTRTPIPLPTKQEETEKKSDEVVLSEEERMEMERKLLLFKSMVGKPLEEIEEEDLPPPTHSAPPAVLQSPGVVDTTPSIGQGTANSLGTSTEVSYAVDSEVAEADPILLPQAVENLPLSSSQPEVVTEPENDNGGGESEPARETSPSSPSLSARAEGESLEDHAYRVLLHLGIIEEHLDPDDPNYDHSNDREFA